MGHNSDRAITNKNSISMHRVGQRMFYSKMHHIYLGNESRMKTWTY